MWLVVLFYCLILIQKTIAKITIDFEMDLINNMMSSSWEHIFFYNKWRFLHLYNKHAFISVVDHDWACFQTPANRKIRDSLGSSKLLVESTRRLSLDFRLWNRKITSKPRFSDSSLGIPRFLNWMGKLCDPWLPGSMRHPTYGNWKPCAQRHHGENASI